MQADESNRASAVRHVMRVNARRNKRSALRQIFICKSKHSAQYDLRSYAPYDVISIQHGAANRTNRRSLFNRVFLQPVEQGVSRQAEQVRGAGLIAGGLFQGLADQAHFHFIQAHTFGRQLKAWVGCIRRARQADFLRQGGWISRPGKGGARLTVQMGRITRSKSSRFGRLGHCIR